MSHDGDPGPDEDLALGVIVTPWTFDPYGIDTDAGEKVSEELARRIGRTSAEDLDVICLDHSSRRTVGFTLEDIRDYLPAWHEECRLETVVLMVDPEGFGPFRQAMAHVALTEGGRTWVAGMLAFTPDDPVTTDSRQFVTFGSGPEPSEVIRECLARLRDAATSR